METFIDMKHFLLYSFAILYPIFMCAQTKKTVFVPDKPNGTAVICCPGGGYETVCDEHEGKGWAQEFNDMGIVWVVVNYELPNGNPEIPFNSILEVMKDLKANASTYHIDTTKIGIAGFSAGGHLAASYSQYAPKQHKPAFQLLFYPVITMDETYTHRGSRNHLLGEKPKNSMVKRYSLEKTADETLPPTLIFVSKDDNVVSPENSLNYYEMLNENNVPTNLHIFPIGNHGWGNSTTFIYHPAILEKLYLFFKDGIDSSNIYEYLPVETSEE